MKKSLNVHAANRRYWRQLSAAEKSERGRRAVMQRYYPTKTNRIAIYDDGICRVWLVTERDSYLKQEHTA